MTMRDLARLANVSVSTVSKAFGDAPDVCPETKKHIFQIAKENGCFGKYYKGKFSKKVFAIICSELVSDYYIGFVERLQTLIEENGGIAVISADHFKEKKQAELIEYYASYLHVDGIVVFGLITPVKKGYDIPIVSIFSSIDTNADAIRLEMKGAINDAVELLYQNGHRRIGFIGESLTHKKATLLQTACQAYKDIQLSLYESPYRFEKAGQDGVHALFGNGETHPCTALICSYDNIAFGAMKELKKLGFSVPEQVSVIGIDNISATEFVQIPLTSIDSVPDEVCAAAWDLLLKKQSNKYFRSNRDIIFKATLIVRDSVAPVSE